ncbi:MAG: tetratricopeptide repeat protein, partial [Bdellovibrionales bacterium]
MSVSQALEALKRKDFAAARNFMAEEDLSAFSFQHFLIKGLSELALEEWADACQTFTEATKRFPDYALFWLNRGIAEENLKQIDAAIVSQEKCLALNPLQVEACGNLSNLYRVKGRFAEAEAMARRALAGVAIKADALNCLGLALDKQGEFDEARASFMQAHMIAPQNPAFLANHANLEMETFNFEEAWKLFAAARAIEDKPVFRHDEGLARLLSGDFKRGFELFEARLEMPNMLRLIAS